MTTKKCFRLLIFFVLIVTAHVSGSKAIAQADTCRVSGTFYLPDGITPAAGVRVTVRNVTLNGKLIVLGPVYYITNGNGFVSFTVPAGATANIEAQVAGFNVRGGVVVQIPNSANCPTTLNSLQTTTLVTTAGLIIQRNDVDVSSTGHKFITIDFDDRFKATELPDQEANIDIWPVRGIVSAPDYSTLALAKQAAKDSSFLLLLPGNYPNTSLSLAAADSNLLVIDGRYKKLTFLGQRTWGFKSVTEADTLLHAFRPVIDSTRAYGKVILSEGTWVIDSLTIDKPIHIQGTTARRPRATETTFGGSIIKSLSTSATVDLLTVRNAGITLSDLTLQGTRSNRHGLLVTRAPVSGSINTTQGGYSINNVLSFQHGGDGFHFRGPDGVGSEGLNAFQNLGYGIAIVSPNVDGVTNAGVTAAGTGMFVSNARSRANQDGGYYIADQAAVILQNVQAISDTNIGIWYDRGRSRGYVVGADIEMIVPGRTAAPRTRGLRLDTMNGFFMANSYIGTEHDFGTFTTDAGTSTTQIVDAALTSTVTDYFKGSVINNTTRGSGEVVVTAYNATTKTLTIASAISGQTSGDTYTLAKNLNYGVHLDSVEAAIFMSNAVSSDIDTTFAVSGYDGFMTFFNPINFDTSRVKKITGGNPKYFVYDFSRTQSGGDVTFTAYNAELRLASSDSIVIRSWGTSKGISLEATGKVIIQPSASAGVHIFNQAGDEERPDFRIYADVNVTVGATDLQYMSISGSGSSSNTIAFNNSVETLKASFAMPLRISGAAGTERYIEFQNQPSGTKPDISSGFVGMYTRGDSVYVRIGSTGDERGLFVSGGGGGGAPVDAGYWVRTSNATLTSETIMGSLATGLVSVTTSTGAASSVTTSAGVFALISDETGSGALVGDTSPSISGASLSSPTLSGNIIVSPSSAGDFTVTSNGTDETVGFDFQAAFTTGNQMEIKQTTGNPTGGTLLAVYASDADVIPFQTTAGGTANGVQLTTGAMLQAIGTGVIDADIFTGSGSTTNAVDLATAEVAGNLAVTNLNSGTSASATTVWHGDGTWGGVSAGDLASTTITAGTYSLPSSITFDADGRATAASQITTLVGLDAIFTDLDIAGAGGGSVLVRRASGVWVDTSIVTITGWTYATPNMYFTSSTDNLIIGSSTPQGKVTIDGDTNEIQLWIQAHSTQSTGVLLIEKSDGTDILTFTNAGVLTVGDATTASNLSVPGGSLSEHFGANSQATGTSSVAVGYDALANTGDRNIAIGRSARATNATGYSTVIGSSASGTGHSGTIVGYNSISTANYATFFGSGHAGNFSSIAIGSSNTVTAANQFVGGSEVLPISAVFFGSGVNAPTTVTSYVINGTSRETGQTNGAGGNITLSAGKSTGSGSGGDLIFQTATPGSSGTTQNALVERMRIQDTGEFDIASTSTRFTTSGAILNFNSGDVLITHSANALTVSDGDFFVVGVSTFTGSPSLILGNGATSAGVLRILEDTDNGSNYTEFTVPALAANVSYTLPPDDGEAGEQLQTNGSGVTTWEPPGGTLTKNIAVENPTSSENLGGMTWPYAVTIDSVRAVLVGSTSPSVTIQFPHGTDRSAAGTNLFSAGQVITSVTTGSRLSSFNDATIAAAEWLWLTTSAQSGTVTWLNITIYYHRD